MEGLQIFFLLNAFIFGAVIGSFLNALLYRFNTGRGILWAHSTSLRASRSRCMHCGHTLGALNLIPIFSYIFLRGRCRYCHSRVSLQYPLVEGTLGLISMLIFLQYPEPVSYLYFLLVWAIILFIVVYDLKHTIIPWSFSVPLALLTLLPLFTQGATPPELLAGPILALPLFLISLFSGGRAMGWGDSFFELSLGWLLGLSLGFSALMLAFWSGAVVGLFLILLSRWKVAQRRFTIRSEIPFAPFLVLGALLAQFLHVDFFSTLPLIWYW